jgi:hypothetical protein
MGWGLAGLILSAVVAEMMIAPTSYAPPSHLAQPAPEAAKLVRNPKTVASGSGEIQITAPGAWRPLEDTIGSAEIHGGNTYRDQYFAAFTESRVDLSSRVTLERYDSLSVELLRSGLSDDTLSEGRAMTIQGRSAIQHVLRGTQDHIGVVYWITTIETPQNFHRVIAWTRASRAAENEPLMQEVIGSFRENTPRTPSTEPAGDGSSAPVQLPITRRAGPA